MHFHPLQFGCQAASCKYTIGKCILCGENTPHWTTAYCFVQCALKKHIVICRLCALQIDCKSALPVTLHKTIPCSHIFTTKYAFSYYAYRQSSLPVILHKTIRCGPMQSIFITEYTFSYCVDGMEFSIHFAACSLTTNLQSTILCDLQVNALPAQNKLCGCWKSGYLYVRRYVGGLNCGEV